jgi:hypothetical protein
MGQTPRFPCYSFRIAGPLAQTVEHLPFKQGVAGSSPARLINNLQLFYKAKQLLGVTPGVTGLRCFTAVAKRNDKI